jgi:hypothetical protein
MRSIAPLLFTLLLVTCTTYDNAIVYHKNFNPGKHPLLQFSGYYSDTLGPKPNPNSAKLEQEAIKPVFFYSNGSAFSADNYEGAYKLLNVNTLQGSWGNYLITSDTIELEKFQLIENNYIRIILKGVISKDKIHWFSRKYHREDYKPVDYSVFFKPYVTKPDSTKNFTRTLPIYNK